MPPGGAISTDVTPAVRAYCRDARRIRGRHAGQPARLHRALRELSHRQDAAPPTATTVSQVAPGRCEAFAKEVEGRLEGPVLRHAQRRALLAAARRMGIGRFEANLVIAAVQHRRVSDGPLAPVQTGRARVFALAPLTLILMVQTLIAWGAWRVLCG